MTTNRTCSREELINFQPRHTSFVGIDSDGCVFDTMEIKQKQCFHGNIISLWKLEPVEKYLRQTAEFVNLYSKWRGGNRFPSLVRVFDLLRDRPEIRNSGIPIPQLTSLRKLIASGAALGSPALEKAVAQTGDQELALILKWSHNVNESIARTVKSIPPFKWAGESLEKIRANSDAICVSQTPCEALIREWEENDLTGYVALIAGQEMGTKTEHLAMSTADRYPPDRILMVGDAPGDHKAARNNNALFYPVNPAHEEESWERFCHEAYDKFLAGKYAGKYEQKVIAEFEALLPETPPW